MTSFEICRKQQIVNSLSQREKMCILKLSAWMSETSLIHFFVWARTKSIFSVHCQISDLIWKVVIVNDIFMEFWRVYYPYPPDMIFHLSFHEVSGGLYPQTPGMIQFMGYGRVVGGLWRQILGSVIIVPRWWRYKS